MIVKFQYIYVYAYDKFVFVKQYLFKVNILKLVMFEE